MSMGFLSGAAGQAIAQSMVSNPNRDKVGLLETFAPTILKMMMQAPYYKQAAAAQSANASKTLFELSQLQSKQGGIDAAAAAVQNPLLSALIQSGASGEVIQHVLSQYNLDSAITAQAKQLGALAQKNPTQFPTATPAMLENPETALAQWQEFARATTGNQLTEIGDLLDGTKVVQNWHDRGVLEQKIGYVQPQINKLQQMMANIAGPHVQAILETNPGVTKEQLSAKVFQDWLTGIAQEEPEVARILATNYALGGEIQLNNIMQQSADTYYKYRKSLADVEQTEAENKLLNEGKIPLTMQQTRTSAAQEDLIGAQTGKVQAETVTEQAKPAQNQNKVEVDSLKQDIKNVDKIIADFELGLQKGDFENPSAATAKLNKYKQSKKEMQNRLMRLGGGTVEENVPVRGGGTVSPLVEELRKSREDMKKFF